MDLRDEEETEEMIPKTPEKNNESNNYLYIILFYFLGAACFVPNNFYITANEYWMYKFRDPKLPFNKSETHKTTLQKNFTSYTGIAGNVGSVVFLFVTFAILKIIPVQKRIIGSMSMLIALFAVTLLFIFIDTDPWQSGFFVVAVGIAGLLSATSSVLLISLFQMAFRFPPRCLAAQLAGQSICGILAALVQIVALVVPSVTGTASLYYAIAVGVMGSTLAAYVTVWYKVEDFRRTVNKKQEDEEARSNTGWKIDFGMLKRVLRKLSLLLISLILSVMVSVILNPGVTALIESSGKGTNAWSDTYFLPVCVFLLFSTMEFIGREVSNYIPILKNIYVIFGTSVIRIVLFPLIILCNIQPRKHLPVVFHSDAYFIIFMILLSLTGGYVQNIVLILLPQYYTTREEKTMTMVLIILAMIGFVTIASVLGGVVVNLI